MVAGGLYKNRRMCTAAKTRWLDRGSKPGIRSAGQRCFSKLLPYTKYMLIAFSGCTRCLLRRNPAWAIVSTAWAKEFWSLTGGFCFHLPSLQQNFVVGTGRGSCKQEYYWCPWQVMPLSKGILSEKPQPVHEGKGNFSEIATQTVANAFHLRIYFSHALLIFESWSTTDVDDCSLLLFFFLSLSLSLSPSLFWMCILCLYLCLRLFVSRSF